MESAKEREIEQRLSRIESTLAALQRSVDGLIGEKRGAAHATEAHPGFGHGSGRASAAAAPTRRTPGDDLGATISEWFSSRAPEWWLSRLGIGFVVIAVLFLYSYAIDRGWITPPIPVVFGAIVGTALFWAATRADREDRSDPYGLGLRQVLYGGALASWYVTAYAAAVWYGLISTGAARLLFFVLAILSTWIALAERREIFGFIAVAAGFATPFILPAPLTSFTPFALYLGAVGAIGLFIYLIRGWQSTIWITFLAFWLVLNGAVSTGAAVRPAAVGSVAISLLAVLAGIAFTRVASLRRELLTIGSARYTPASTGEVTRRVVELQDAISKALGGGKSAADSLALWVMTLLSPILAVSILVGIWPRIPAQVGGLILVGLGSAALSFGMSKIADREFRQVVLTGSALWAVLGILKIAPEPEQLALAALFAAAVLVYIRNALIGPRTVAKATIAITLAVVAGHELSFQPDGILRWRWIISEAVVVVSSVFISRKLIADAAERIQGVVLAGLTYVTTLLVILNVLQPIWTPLVTATYAVLAAVLLVMSKRRENQRMLRQLGGVTILIVVARLLFVDMASVETVWRVLLFLLCGGLFLYTGYRLQLARNT